MKDRPLMASELHDFIDRVYAPRYKADQATIAALEARLRDLTEQMAAYIGAERIAAISGEKRVAA